MKFQKRYFFALAGVLILAISSCTDKISTIGGAYVADTVQRGATAFGDTVTVRLTSFQKPTVSALGISYNLNNGSPYLFIGNVPSENLVAYPVMNFPILTDSVGVLLDDSLQLFMHNGFYYGDGSSQNFSFNVRLCPQATDSVGNVSQLMPLGAIVGSYSGMPSEDSILSISIQLDTGLVFAAARTSSFTLVLEPTNMNSIRAIASEDNGTATLNPTMKFTVQGPTGNYTSTRYPVYDYHVVGESFSPPAGTFELRGSRGQREQIVINTKAIRNALSLNPFVTINSAQLQFAAVPNAHTFALDPVDTVIPALIYRDSTTADSIAVIASYGVRSATNTNVFLYQIRTDIEYAVRNSLDSLVFELRTGYGSRSFGGTFIMVEDYDVDKWLFYSPVYSDTTLRPKLFVTYSFLK